VAKALRASQGLCEVALETERACVALELDPVLELSMRYGAWLEAASVPFDEATSSRDKACASEALGGA